MGSKWDFLQVAQNNVGYKSGTTQNNICDWYGWGGYWAWCDAFYSWCAGYSDNLDAIGGKFAYVPNHRQWFINQGRWSDKWGPLAEGSAIIFDWDLDGLADHIGLVEWADDSYVGTIEGNTNAWPGEVARHTYSRNYACIMGFGNPLFSDGVGTSGVAPVSPPSGEAPAPIITDYSIKYFVKTAGGLYFDAKDGAEIDTGGRPITGIAVTVDNGSIWYQARDDQNDWNARVTGCDWNDYHNGWAGDNVPIDLIAIYLNSINGDKVVKYQVAPIGQGYFPVQRDVEVDANQDGFAGDYGLPFDRIKIWIDNY